MKKQEKKTPLLDLEALYFILVMLIYETYCWQIYRLDQTCLGPVKEHRVGKKLIFFSIKVYAINLWP